MRILTIVLRLRLGKVKTEGLVGFVESRALICERYIPSYKEKLYYI